MPYRLLKSFLTPILLLLFRPKVRGLDSIPNSGPVIIASNHLSFSDSIFMPLVVSRKVTFLAKQEYFTQPGIKGWIKKLTFIALGQVPVDRSGGRASEAAVRTGVELLEEGECIGIYPEGTRSPDGRLYRGRTGIARLALESGAVVVPVAMINTEKIQPTGKVIPKIMRVGIYFGKPMNFKEQFSGSDPNDPFVLRSITDSIMKEIQSLSGQEYVDIYATRAKELLQKGEEIDDESE